MVNRLEFSLAMQLIAYASIAQTPTVLWQTTLGGSVVDQGYGLTTTADGCVAVGLAFSTNGQVVGNHGAGDAWVVRLDDGGEVIWQRCFGGSDYDNASAVAKTPSGGFVCAGVTRSTDGNVSNTNGNYDMWAFQIDENGDLLWENSLGGTQSDWAFGVTTSSDSGVIVVGRTYSADGDVEGFHGDVDAWVVKLDQSGTILWQRALGGSAFDIGQDVIETTDGNILVVGASSSIDGDVLSGQAGGGDAWVVMLNPEGELLWERTLGGSASDGFRAVVESDDGGFVLAGTTQSTEVPGYHAGRDGWVAKIDATGTIIWQLALGGADVDELFDLESDVNGGYVLCGQTKSSDGDLVSNLGDYDGWLLRLSNAGEIDWSTSMGGFVHENLYDIGVTVNGDYIFGGLTNSNDGELASNHGGYDVWLVKLGLLETSIGARAAKTLEVTPNPTSGVVRVRVPTTGEYNLLLSDPLGKVIREWKMNSTSEVLSLEDVRSGIFFLSLQRGGIAHSHRLIIE